MNEVFEQATKLLEENGYSIYDYLRETGAYSSSLMNLSSETQEEFNNYYDQLIVGVSGKREKGELLEKLTSSLFNNDLFCIRRNCRTSTNEIDVLVDWSKQARICGLNSAYPFLGELVLCECKNYEKSIGVTYIGKFASLLSATSTSTGIMVSWEGVSGQKWSYGSGLIKKIQQFRAANDTEQNSRLISRLPNQSDAARAENRFLCFRLVFICVMLLSRQLPRPSERSNSG